MDEILTKRTAELMNELTKSGMDFQTYIDNNFSSLIEVNLAEFWESMIAKSTMQRCDIINKAHLSRNYFYEIVKGKKVPNKDKIVSLCIAMGVSLEDTQTALKYCGKNPLYPRLKRDSALIFAITNNYSVLETNEMLRRNGEDILK